ncbi:MAG: response regulator [Bryobacter sp.]|nr:response regulator [Bryobacter sp. CoA8 C33]
MPISPVMEEILNLDRIKHHFLAALNHEVRTPLSGILGMTTLLEQSNLSPGQLEYVQLTRACAEELYSSLSSALEFAALAAGNCQLGESDFLLLGAIESVAAHWLVKARQKGLTFLLELAEDVPESASGDEIRLRKVLDYLLSNAIKFTDRGEVELSVRVSGTAHLAAPFQLHVSVRDTGIGLDSDQITRVFESFEQLDSGLSRRYSGLGLGLTIARGLTRILGGELQVSSTPGKGSVFSFSIPLQHSSLDAPVLALKQRKILVVDDNDAARRIADAYLKRDGFHATLAASGFQALEFASKNHYDLILMDLQMPGLDGIETTSRLRGLSGYEHTPVLALTASSGDEWRQLCLSKGIQAYLPKPVDSDLLLRTIRQLLDS